MLCPLKFYREGHRGCTLFCSVTCVVARTHFGVSATIQPKSRFDLKLNSNKYKLASFPSLSVFFKLTNVML